MVPDYKVIVIRSHKHHTPANGLLQGKFRLTTLAACQGLWSLERFHWNCYRVDPWKENKKTVNYWCAQYSFCFNTLKLRNYVRAIDDIIVKQVERKDINVMLILAYAHVTCIFNTVLWSENQVVDKIFVQNLQNCQVINLLRNGTSKPWVPCQTSAKIIHVAQICQKKFWMVHF